MTAPIRADGVDAIVVAAGGSSRMGGIDKVAVPVAGRPLLAWTVDAIAGPAVVDRIVVVVAPERVLDARTIVGREVAAIVPGGARRHESVEAGLAALERLDAAAGATDAGRQRVVLVHDGARPLVPAAVVDAVAAEARLHGAAIPAIPLTDTVKRVADGRVVETLDRGAILAAQTPQGARRHLLLEAFRRFPPDGQRAWPDEASLLEACGFEVRTVPGTAENRKVTVPADLALVDAALGGGRWRLGIGADSHPFGPGAPLLLGGVEIAGAPRLHGHSDGDVALHAVADAILGAAGLGDLGRRFPADDRTPAGSDSAGLLASVVSDVAEAGWRVADVDVTIVGARPRLSAHLDAMRGRLGELLGPLAAVSVKASSGNLGGDEGAGRSISAIAVVGLARR